MQAIQGFAATPKAASPKASRSDAKIDNANDVDHGRTGQDEEAAGMPADPLAAIAAAIAGLAPADRQRLAAMLGNGPSGG